MFGRAMLRAIAPGLVLCAAGAEAQARTRTTISPYIEVDQTVVTDLKGGNGDVLTYTSVVAGVSANIATRRAEAQIDVQYEHQFGWNRATPDQDVLSGIASARYSLIPDKLSIEGGALATRARTDGFNLGNGASAGSSTTQVYSAYVGPTFTSRIGEFSVNAAYRLGYARVEDDVNFAGPSGLGAFSDSVFQSATASIGMQPGVLPFGWALGAGWDHEDTSELDQRYDDKWIRGDVTVPVAPTLALVGGVGYERIRISQRGALLDNNGFPVLGSGGRLVTDPTSPRLLAYDSDGLIWDAGVLWRPSRRTSLELRVGRRYDSMHYVGSFSWQPSPNSAVNIALFDTVDSFGRALGRNLDDLPTSFDARRNPFSGDLTGCVNGDQGGGACFNDALTGITSANYHHRGIAGQYSRTAGRWSMGAGAGYAQRKFIAPNSSVFAAINGAKDENYYADLFAGYRFDNDASLDATVYGNFYNAGRGGIDVTNLGSYVTYSRSFGRRLSAQASLGVDSVDPAGLDAIISALGQVGMRYQF
ncbi:hypothetical protein [Sphingobium subterraneum]|uniref:Glycine-rich cell wall structural protein n=1 Tax=Sphingobium subterraneum TaxID=627688 RepID=A0A841IX82_9SPHN|nr:hypothetical protein [Sphingobium subterraneum]MBB6122752.1 hypothetical protein [Sphingobium subterraneum]